MVALATLLITCALTARPAITGADYQGKINIDKLRAEADSLTRKYRFAEAVSLYSEAKELADSVQSAAIDEVMATVQNGESMTAFCSTPVCLARQKFPIRDFFLYYPLEDKSWHPTPNQLDSTAGDIFAPAVYMTESDTRLFWSAKDSDGIRNIYFSKKDSIWSAPALLNEQLTSDSDEIFPMLSPDGKQLFFASKGLYGMGGYDLYVSTWDEENRDWGLPVNMGFPYSSPYDDFLFINTADGKYSIFASNRDCQSDSVSIYVLEYDSMPVRKAIDSPENLAKLCALTPTSDKAVMSGPTTDRSKEAANDDVVEYSRKLRTIRELRDSLYSWSVALDGYRSSFNEADDNERQRLSALISEKEAVLPLLKDSLARMSNALQQIEVGFLKKGVVIDPEKLQQEADKEIIGATSGYVFTRHDIGKPLHLDMMKPKPSFDYSFQILPEGRFAEDNTLPKGLIYQIQLFALSRKATTSQLRGISPVFESISTGKYIYSAGIFHTYKDVLGSLNKVKRAGLRSAFIVAFNDGVKISVPTARKIESETHEIFQIRIYPTDGEALAQSEIGAVRSATNADMAKVNEDGRVSYILGPFADRTEAEHVLYVLKTAGIAESEIESAGYNKDL